MSSNRRVVVLATLDTKEAEASYVAACLRTLQCTPWLVDVGTAEAAPNSADTGCDEVRARAGHTKESFAALDKTAAMEATAAGATSLLRGMLAEGGVAGVIGIGGGQGTWIAASVMRALPLGLPKVLVTSIAHRAGYHVRGADIAVFPSVTDIAGLNRVLRRVLANASAALAGMVGGRIVQTPADRPAVAMSMFGVTTVGGDAVRERLEDAGLEVLVFHANGLGGAAMESLVDEGSLSGVVDWTTTELTDEVVGGIASAGPSRMEAAARAGVPQVVVPGAVDVVNFGPPDTVPSQHAGRVLHQHTPAATLMRANAAELARVATVMARKLNAAKGPVHVLVPGRGFSALDREGGPFWDAAADQAFVDALRAELRDGIACDVLPLHVNTPEFAVAVAEAFLALAGRAATTASAGAEPPG